MRCPASGRAIGHPPGQPPGRARCPECGRDIALTAHYRLRPHDVQPVLRGVAYDDKARRGRGGWVAAVQRGRVMILSEARDREQALAGARDALAGRST